MTAPGERRVVRSALLLLAVALVVATGLVPRAEAAAADAHSGVAVSSSSVAVAAPGQVPERMSKGLRERPLPAGALPVASLPRHVADDDLLVLRVDHRPTRDRSPPFLP